MNREPKTIGEVMGDQFPEPWVRKIRRELLYANIFRLYDVLKLNTKRLFYNDLLDVLLTYDLDLLISHRDALMAQCVREGVDRYLILGE